MTAVSPGHCTGSIPEDDVVSRKAFSEFLDRFAPDLVHFHCIQTLTASLLDETKQRGIPSIVTVHDGWWISDSQFLLRTDGTLVQDSGSWGDPKRLARLKRALIDVDQVFTVSHYFAKLYQKQIGVPVSVIPNPVARLQASMGPTEGPLMVGFLGGLGRAKGGDLIYQALCLRAFPNLRFIVVDHEAAEGQDRLEYWGNNPIEIIGKVKQSNITELYTRINVVLAPSVCVESFGLVVREAISLGRWVVVSDRGALSELVKEESNGNVIDVSNFAGLFRVFTRLNSNPARYRHQNDSKPPLVDPEVTGREYVKAYETILQNKSRNICDHKSALRIKYNA